VPGFEGSFTLLVTPFDAEGRVDGRSLAALVDHHLRAGAQGLFAVCGTSEMAQLDAAERLAVAGAAVRSAGGAVPVIAAANLEPDPAAQGDEVARMAATGVDGVVLVPPRSHGGDPGELEAYLATLAARSAVPVLLYEWPGSRPSEIPPSVYAHLVAHHGVVGIKDTRCTLEGIGAKIAAAPGGAVFQAHNPLLLAALELGARGTMTITSAARPDLLAALWRAHVAGQREDAVALERAIVALDRAIGPCHPGGAKWMLQQAGVIANAGVRSGRLPDPSDLARLRDWVGRAPAWRGA
jgi:4-hydroxy-tetrahydrodipicolinate synthase